MLEHIQCFFWLPVFFSHLSEHVIQQNLSCISFSTTLKIHLKRRVVAYQTSLLTLATGVLLSWSPNDRNNTFASFGFCNAMLTMTIAYHRNNTFASFGFCNALLTMTIAYHRNNAFASFGLCNATMLTMTILCNDSEHIASYSLSCTHQVINTCPEVEIISSVWFLFEKYGGEM